MRIRIVEVSIPEDEYVEVPQQSHLKQLRTYYKIQTSWLGLIWKDAPDPVYELLYPIFDTIEEAKDYVKRVYLEREVVVAEYRTK